MQFLGYLASRFKYEALKAVECLKEELGTSSVVVTIVIFVLVLVLILAVVFIYHNFAEWLEPHNCWNRQVYLK